MTQRSLALLLLVVAVPLFATAQRRPATPPRPARPEIAPPELARDSAGNIVFNREVYTYPRASRRDPFQSLITSGDVRPLLADLEVGGIMFDPTGRNSLATLKDKSTGELYRARVGSVFGRMRVTAITRYSVTIAIDEFGSTRQEVLSTNAPRGGRTP
jgi:hypothetical protein